MDVIEDVDSMAVIENVQGMEVIENVDGLDVIQKVDGMIFLYLMIFLRALHFNLPHLLLPHLLLFQPPSLLLLLPRPLLPLLKARVQYRVSSQAMMLHFIKNITCNRPSPNNVVCFKAQLN